MKFQHFTQVALTEDIPQYQLKKGDIGTIVEYYPMPQSEEDGYSLEGLLPQDTLEVSESQIELVTLSALTHA
jgi:hypothetical protein